MCVSVSLEVPAIGESEANLQDRRWEYDGSVQQRPYAGPCCPVHRSHRRGRRTTVYFCAIRATIPSPQPQPGDRHMRTLAVIGLLAILAVIAKAVFLFGGYYNVGATSEDPKFVDWTLARIRQASIEHYATD